MSLIKELLDNIEFTKEIDESVFDNTEYKDGILSKYFLKIILNSLKNEEEEKGK